MKPGRLQEVAAAVWLGVGVINGASALNANDEAVKAEVTATALEAKGNTQAAEWHLYSDKKEDDRNRSLFFAASDLAIAATFIALSKRPEQEPQSDTPVESITSR